MYIQTAQVRGKAQVTQYNAMVGTVQHIPVAATSEKSCAVIRQFKWSHRFYRITIGHWTDGKKVNRRILENLTLSVQHKIIYPAVKLPYHQPTLFGITGCL